MISVRLGVKTCDIDLMESVKGEKERKEKSRGP